MYRPPAGAFKAYLNAVEHAFGSDIDYAQLIKIYCNAPEHGEVRYAQRYVWELNGRLFLVSLILNMYQQVSLSVKI